VNAIKWFIWNYPTASVLILAGINAVAWGIPFWKLYMQFWAKPVGIHHFSPRRSPFRRASHSASSVGR
jgi:hypothetical protein